MDRNGRHARALADQLARISRAHAVKRTEHKESAEDRRVQLEHKLAKQRAKQDKAAAASIPHVVTHCDIVTQA